MQERKKILITGAIEADMVNKIAEYHEVDTLPFIDIEPIETEEVKKKLEELSEKELHIVFTSNNGVQVVANMLDKKPATWKMFSIEGVTSKAVMKHFGEDSLAATAFSGEELAKEILESGNVKEVVFFCGDLRRDELPERLRVQGLNVKEIIVYNTIATPVKLEKDYDAVLFFSPSAVYSYVSLNKINEGAVCFAIGNTTANTIKNIVPNKVLVAQPPQKERVVEMLIEYYKENQK